MWYAKFSAFNKFVSGSLINIPLLFLISHLPEGKKYNSEISSKLNLDLVIIFVNLIKFSILIFPNT